MSLTVASRYSAKVLSPKPKKFMSPRFFGDMLAAAASKVLFVEDVEQLDKIQHRLDLRSAWGTRLDRAVMITFSRRHYQTIGRKGIGASKFRGKRHIAASHQRADWLGLEAYPSGAVSRLPAWVRPPVGMLPPTLLRQALQALCRPRWMRHNTAFAEIIDRRITFYMTVPSRDGENSFVRAISHPARRIEAICRL
jgi:hypothetical protein